MTQPLPLRERAEAEAGRMPPLLARAEHLAGTVLLENTDAGAQGWGMISGSTDRRRPATADV